MRTAEDLAFDLCDILLPFLLALLIVPKLHFEDLAGHRFDIFGSVVLVYRGKDQYAFTDRGYEVAINCD